MLLNRGDGTFLSPVAYDVGQAPTSLVSADFGNGHVDLATANSNSGDVSILLGNGDGTFQSQLRFAAGPSPHVIASADFNSDGRVDLAVASSNPNTISVLLGRGDGTFQDAAANSVGSGALAITTADLNRDGYNDVITADFYSNDVSVLLGNGDGTFRAARSFPAGIHPTAVVAGDFNGDGRLDLAITDAGNSDGTEAGVSILLGNGDGTFQAPSFYPAGELPWSIAAGDFTGNGILDLAVANLASNDVTILFGDGHGGFPSSIDVPLGDQADEPVSILAGHFTGGPALDLAVGEQTSDTVSILQNNGHGGFVALPPIPVLPTSSLDGQPSTLVALAAGDFLGTGHPQIAALSAGSDLDGTDQVSIIASTSGGVAALPPTVVGSGIAGNSMVAGTFFGSSALGLAITEQYAGTVILLEGNGHGAFSTQTTLDVGSEQSLNVIAAADSTGDGLLDLAVAASSPNSVAIELNLGAGQFAPSGPVGLALRNNPVVADWSGDGASDVAIVDAAGDILFRHGLPGEPGQFAPPVTVNPGRPSRDIAAVTTSQGTLLASVDARDNNVSLYAFANGLFSLVGVLGAGLQPAQIVSADLLADSRDDLVIRNAGDGTLTVYLANPQGGFHSQETLTVGPGICKVTVADVNQDGLPDLLLANQTAGEVEVMLNLGVAGFSTLVPYRAGSGLSAQVDDSSGEPASVVSQDRTVGVAAVPMAGGTPPVLVALDAGSNTLGILAGLGNGQFANPVALPTSGPTLAARSADFNGDGLADLAVLGPNGLSIWLGNGKGGFAAVASYDVGPDSTGLAIANLNGSGTPDLLVGNAFGDVLVLLGQGNGQFQSPQPADRSVGLAVGYSNVNGSPTFVFVDQGRDRIVVQNGPLAPVSALADRSMGLLVPGAPVLADLGGNGIEDLIVPNSGGDNVLVYPGLPDGGFGPALNAGNGFFTGTNPVAVVVADVNGDGRPDLIVANEGSNDVSILLNEPAPGGFTFEQGPRLNAGVGPVALLYGNFTGNGVSDILVSDSGSKALTLLRGVGDGFFDDSSPIIFPLIESPGLIFAGPFRGGPELDVAALDPGTGDVTLISGFASGVITQQIVSSGGLDPVAAFTVRGPGGFEDLVVANNADGGVSLLQGSLDGLILTQINSTLAGLGPSGLALAAIHGNDLEVYASAEGSEGSSILLFSLASSSQALGTSLTLGFTQEQALPLVATFSILESVPGTAAEETGAVDGEGAAAASFGQGPFGTALARAVQGDSAGDSQVAETVHPILIDQTPWKKIMMGLEEAFDEFRHATQTQRQTGGASESNDELEAPASDSPDNSCERVSRFSEPARCAIVDASIDELMQTSFTSTPAELREECCVPKLARVRVAPQRILWLALGVSGVAWLPPAGTRPDTFFNDLPMSPGRSPHGTRASRRGKSRARVFL